MKKAKILWVGIILILVRVPEVKAMGLGEWGFNRSLGISLHNTYGPTQIDVLNETISNVEEWYFYKKHIIGFCGKKDQNRTYFVLNEGSKEIFRFQEFEKWKKFIRQKKLKPKIWTRWFRSHDSVFLMVLVIYSIYFWFISIPLLILFLWGVFKLKKEVFFVEKFNLKEPFTRVLIFIVFLNYVFYYFNATVQSF